MAKHALKSRKKGLKLSAVSLAVIMGFVGLSGAPAFSNGSSQTSDVVIYQGPIPVTLNPGLIFENAATEMVVNGYRLTGVLAVTINNITIPITDASYGSFSFTLPGLKTGAYDMIYTSTSGELIRRNAVVVLPAPFGPGDSEFYVAKRFTNFVGDDGMLTGSDRNQILKFVSENVGLTKVTCVGSTSGVPALETDTALALQRAKSTCDLIERLVPGVETKLATNVGLGTGQFFRAVSVFGKGVIG
jgi:hypothetical protein